MPLFRFPIQFCVIGCENFLLQNGKKTKSSKVFAMIFICSALNMSRRILKLGENTFKMDSRIDKSYKYAKKNYRKKRRNNLTRCWMDAIHTFNLYVVFSVIFVCSSLGYVYSNFVFRMLGYIHGSQKR